MYRLPVINTPVSALELDLTEGNNERRMYKLPNIQNLIITETGADKLIELENRQEAILKQLQDLKLRVSSIKEQNNAEKDHHSLLDVVIHSSYRTPPDSVPIACSWLQERACLKVLTSSHVHSSVKKPLPQYLLEFLPSSNCQTRAEANVIVTIIWKEDMGRDPECFISRSSSKKIKGEVNLMRFLHRQFGLLSGPDHQGVASDEVKADELMDRIHSGVVWGALANDSVGNEGSFQQILADIERVVAKQGFLQQAKVSFKSLLQDAALCIR